MRLVIDEHRCKGCNLCTLVCPYRIFQEGQLPGPRGYVIPVLDHPARCTNCRLQKMYGRQLEEGESDAVSKIEQLQNFGIPVAMRSPEIPLRVREVL